MKESKSSRIGEFISQIFSFIFGAYFLSTMLAIPYFNWKYANEHGFINWVAFGEVIATGKGLVWPYFVFYADKETPKEPLPDSVNKLFLSIDAFTKAIEILQKAENEQAGESKIMEMVTEAKTYISSALYLARQINIEELNQILPGWGDHVRGECIEGMKLMNDSMETSNHSKWEAGFDKIQLWNKWMGENRKSITAILKKKYGFVPPES